MNIDEDEDKGVDDEDEEGDLNNGGDDDFTSSTTPGGRDFLIIQSKRSLHNFEPSQILE